MASATILLVVFWTTRRLSRAAAGWDRQRLGSEEFLVSDGLGPAVLGFFRPKIILPPWTLKLQPEKLEMILVHEKEHQAAKDPALLALGVFLAATTPWNPALWWMARRLHLAVEADCDARVLARGIQPQAIWTTPPGGGFGRATCIDPDPGLGRRRRDLPGKEIADDSFYRSEKQKSRGPCGHGG